MKKIELTINEFKIISQALMSHELSLRKSLDSDIIGESYSNGFKLEEIERTITLREDLLNGNKDG